VNWINRHPEYRGEVAIRRLASKQARGEVFPWNLSKPKGLDGMPNLPKVVFEHTRNTLDAIKLLRVPVMILPAEKEELFPNSKNSELVYEMLKTQVPTEIDCELFSHSIPFVRAGMRQKKCADFFLFFFSAQNRLAGLPL